MPFYKLNMFFSQGKQGWSDTYYVEATDPQNAYGSSLLMMQTRIGLLVTPAQCEAVRISDESIYRDSSLFDLPSSAPFSLSINPDVPWNAFMVRLEAQAKYWRQVYIRGIPDAMWMVNPTATDTSIQLQWFQQLTAYIAQFTKGTSPFRIKAISKNPLYGLFPLTNAVPNSTDETDWSVGSSAGWNAGDSVSFLNTGLKPAPGKQIVFAIPDGTHIRTKYRPYRDDYSTFNDKAKFRKNVYEYIKPDFGTWERIVHRIVGRPFGLQRGRRPA